MADVISKDSIIDMPDNSDMIAEAMKEVSFFNKCRPNTQSITSKWNTWCQNISSKSSMRNTEQTGIVSWAKTSLRMWVTNPKTTFSSTKDNWPSYCTKLVDLFKPYFYHHFSGFLYWWKIDKYLGFVERWAWEGKVGKNRKVDKKAIKLKFEIKPL